MKSVMSRRRGRRRPVPMHHQRVLGVQSSSSTAGRQNTGGSAHCRKQSNLKSCCVVECVCVCVCVSRPCEAQRESPARPRPSRSVSCVRVLTSFRFSCPRLPSAKLPRARSVELRVWDDPSSRSSAARLALGDNLVTGPRGRKRVIVRASPVTGPSPSLPLPVLSPSSAPPICCPSTAPPSPTHLWPPLPRAGLARRPLHLS